MAAIVAGSSVARPAASGSFGPAGQQPSEAWQAAKPGASQQLRPATKPSDSTRSIDTLSSIHSALQPPAKVMTTPSGKVIGPRQRKIALLGSRSVGQSLHLTQFIRAQPVREALPRSGPTGLTREDD